VNLTSPSTFTALPGTWRMCTSGRRPSHLVILALPDLLPSLHQNRREPSGGFHPRGYSWRRIRHIYILSTGSNLPQWIGELAHHVARLRSQDVHQLVREANLNARSLYDLQ